MNSIKYIKQKNSTGIYTLVDTLSTTLTASEKLKRLNDFRTCDRSGCYILSATA